MDSEIDFHGAKVALFHGEQLLVYRRDDDQEIPFPNMLDIPGGGRENGESGVDCVVRETREEFGIEIDRSELELINQYQNWRGAGKPALFYVGNVTKDQIASIKFGDEGQGWQLMLITDYLTSNEAVPHLQTRLREYIERR